MIALYRHKCDHDTDFPACSPPEELVLPRSFPRAPVAFLSAVLSPLAWQFGRPDLFDTYSVGILLMQLCGKRTSAIRWVP